MNPDDRTPDEQELLDKYTSKMGRCYEVWDKFVLRGTFMIWEDAVIAASDRWMEMLSVYDCRVCSVGPYMASIEAQDTVTLRWMTTTTVIVLNTNRGDAMGSMLYRAEFAKNVLGSSEGKWDISHAA